MLENHEENPGTGKPNPELKTLEWDILNPGD